ncbi:MAG: hypothetical protein ACK53R_04885, partial [Bacteroidota bacterium]
LYRIIPVKLILLINLSGMLHSIHLLYYVAQLITSGSVKGLLMLQEKLYIGGLLPKNIATKNQFGISPTVIFFHFSKMVRNCKSVSERLPAKTAMPTIGHCFFLMTAFHGRIILI